MHPSGQTPEVPVVLLVEDDPISRDILIHLLENQGIRTCSAETGELAWTLICERHREFDAILLDRLLPDMDSLELLQRLRRSPQIERIPVIMQTMLDSSTDIADGLQAGAFYYQTKPIVPQTLLAIVRAAIAERCDYRILQHSLRQSQRTFRHLRHAEFAFRTMDDARDLATMAAHATADPERTVLGLTELMYNAIEHGNLGISYAEKSVLLSSQGMAAEIARRLACTEYSGRQATLRIDRHAGETQFTIHDQGCGFDWQRYIELSPERAFDTHGRGIAMAAMLSFDSLEYCGNGNQVICRVRDQAANDAASTNETLHPVSGQVPR